MNPSGHQREYEHSHPWIDFQATDINAVDPVTWMRMGEARSKCQHLAGTPLRPDVARKLYEVTLVKGALASAAIEGNTLSEEQAEGIYRGTFQAPPSRAYQERELKNMIAALKTIDDMVVSGQGIRITPELIKSFNFKVLDGTDYEDHVVPGEHRTGGVGVGQYRGPQRVTLII